MHSPMVQASPRIITIGMPLFNAESFLAEAINSLLSQSRGDFRLVISDNASTDGTEDICRSYVKADSRIFYYRQPANNGARANFESVLNAADTPFFMWAAGDDLWAPSYIETCISHLQSDSSLALVASLVVPFVNNIYSSPTYNLYALPSKTPWRTRQNYLIQPEELGKANLIYGVYRTSLCKAVTRKTPFGSNWGSDMNFVYNYLCHGNLHVIDQPLFFKRQIPADLKHLTHDKLDHADHERIARQELISTWNNHSIYYFSYILSDARDRHAPWLERLKLIGWSIMLLSKKIGLPAQRLLKMIISHRSDMLKRHASDLWKKYHRSQGV